ncbi:peptide chain release factor N(5)-glutamine methyltransferase [Cloacibacterium sp.]|uniref:peptide chain release factor N(5)-glutamine methyltransferase n=1 Tax=Cloacibacterium sp. TaxID=1913682 RepID=UPI0039E290A9
MTILEFKRHFKKELSGIYNDAESAQLYSIFLYEKTGFDNFQQRRFASQELLISDEKELNEIIEELKTGKPYQQILGHTEFYGKKFFVDENVLIPRPETEELVELAINKIPDSRFEIPDFKILDVGTGSGIIPITLKRFFPNAEISAIDISEKALGIAKKNAEFHQANIQFIQQDYLNTKLEENYDIIISNPPYIGIEENIEIEDSVKGFEPNIALFSPTSDALIFYKKIAKDGEKYLKENGMIFLEINQKLGKETLELFSNYSESRLIKDLSGNDRFVFAKK